MFNFFFQKNTPYSKMAAILVFFCFHANWPLWSLWPCSRLNILLNFAFESEAIRANFHGNKRILKWWPFWNKVDTFTNFKYFSFTMLLVSKNEKNIFFTLFYAYQNFDTRQYSVLFSFEVVLRISDS